MIAVKRKVHFIQRERGRKTISLEPRPTEAVGTGRTPRISRLMALAIHFDRLIREGKVSGVAELARLCHVTQPRMTQVMNLNHLAPDIQEQLLFLPKVMNGRDPIHERLIRPLSKLVGWRNQRQRWAGISRRLQAVDSPPTLGL